MLRRQSCLVQFCCLCMMKLVWSALFRIMLGRVNISTWQVHIRCDAAKDASELEHRGWKASTNCYGCAALWETTSLVGMLRTFFFSLILLYETGALILLNRYEVQQIKAKRRGASQVIQLMNFDFNQLCIVTSANKVREQSGKMLQEMILINCPCCRYNLVIYSASFKWEAQTSSF